MMWSQLKRGYLSDSFSWKRLPRPLEESISQLEGYYLFHCVLSPSSSLPQSLVRRHWIPVLQVWHGSPTKMEGAIKQLEDEHPFLRGQEVQPFSSIPSSSRGGSARTPARRPSKAFRWLHE